MRKAFGIDLGTANMLVYVKGTGIVIDEPSVVALDKTSGKVVAVGERAKDMIGRTPENIIAERPLKDGVIAQYTTTKAMIRYFIRKVLKTRFGLRPNLVICAPYGITDVEKRALSEVALQSGCYEHGTYLIEEPMAAAIGAGLPVEQATGSMIVDIGGGTAEVAVVSLGGIVTSRSLRVAGDAIDRAIQSYIKKTTNLNIGEKMAEDIKCSIGCAYVDDETEEERMLIKGRDTLTGLPKTIEITNFQVAEAVFEPVMAIVQAIIATLEETPPELSADILDHGICLSGGGALLYGIDTMIEKNTGLKVSVAEDPLCCVALGTGMVLEDMETYENVLQQARTRV